MDTSRKTEITHTEEGTAAEVESARARPGISPCEEIAVPEDKKINHGAEDSTREATLARGEKRGGPRTAEGKRRSAANSKKHAIFSKVTVLETEPRREFDSLVRELWNHLEPRGPLEELLTDKIASLVWRYRRLLLAEGEQNKRKLLDWNSGGASTVNFELLLRYQVTLDGAFYRALSQLERLQGIRKGQPAPPTLNINLP